MTPEQDIFCRKKTFILPDARALAMDIALPDSAIFPEGPIGVMVFAHGMLEYAGRYQDWASVMAKSGWAVFSVDHSGHGRSDGPRIWMDRLDDLVDDFERFVREIAAIFSEKPLHIVGMSMGGGIAIRTVFRLQQAGIPCAGMILVSPALQVHPKVFPWLRRIAYFADWLTPRLRFVRGTSHGLCHDRSVIEAFKKDPYVYSGRFSVHYGVENLRALEENNRLAGEIRLPLLILQGTGDLITNPEGPRRWMEKSISSDKTLKNYPGLYHDLLHEPEKEAIYKDMINWLNCHQENKIVK